MGSGEGEMGSGEGEMGRGKREGEIREGGETREEQMGGGRNWEVKWPSK